MAVSTLRTALLLVVFLASCTACRAALESNWTQFLELPSWDEDEWWEELDPDCEESRDGSFAVTQGPTVCILNVTLADEVEGRLGGSIDGVYKAFGCLDGHAAFYRLDSQEDDERVLWYSEADRDWNISPGLVPDPRLVMAFGGGDAEPRPNLVSQHKWWYVKQELVSVEDMFIKGDGLRVECLEADPDADL